MYTKQEAADLARGGLHRWGALDREFWRGTQNRSVNPDDYPERVEGRRNNIKNKLLSWSTFSKYTSLLRIRKRQELLTLATVCQIYFYELGMLGNIALRVVYGSSY